ncbi:MAG: hypothetical protein JEZ09_08185 [Salinivirgaceae bacterium]|nr:hypothetical protein [Salinivirgaceae bacterium]
MRTIDLNKLPQIKGFEKEQPILLGHESIEETPLIKSVIEPKLKKEFKTKIPGFWGYITPAGDTPLNWAGEITCSRNGNDNSKGVTLEEIRLIHQANPHLAEENLKVTEHFISFQNAELGFPEEFSLDDIPRFNLSIMLNSDEGALVYYQYHDELDEENDAISYILPEPTNEDHSFDRDRLNYIVESLPPGIIQENSGNTEKPFRISKDKNRIKFVIKVLTYFRGQEKTSHNTVLSQLKNLVPDVIQSKFEKDTRLLLYKRSASDFQEVNGEGVDTTKKTLLLIHGTFGTTEASFKALYKSSEWLNHLLDDESYDQILGFDHPTAFKDAEENIMALFSYFGDKIFEKPVDLIGTSQGGLLAQYLANYKENNNPFTVGKIAIVASANGVDYLTTATNLAKLLGILKSLAKKSGKPVAALIASLAQHSFKYIVKLPGLDLMKPGSTRLNYILDNTPINPNTVYLPVIDDFTKQLVKDEKLIKRWAALGLDLLTRIIMGKHNDWVVRTKNQYLVPKAFCEIPNYNPDKYETHIIPAIHGRCLSTSKAKENIKQFLTN